MRDSQVLEERISLYCLGSEWPFQGWLLSELCHVYRKIKVTALRGARRRGRNEDGDSVIGFNIKLGILAKCSQFPPQIIKKPTKCSKTKVVTLLINNYLDSFQIKITTKKLGAVCCMQTLLFLGGFLEFYLAPTRLWWESWGGSRKDLV